MKRYSVSKIIQASPEKIWRILTNIDDYPNWNPGVNKIEGSLKPGKKIKIFAKISPNRAFPAKVTTLEPCKKMIWTGGAPLKFMFKGERTFTLVPQENGITKFDMQEVFSGVMSPLIPIPDLTPSFQEFAEALKVKAEA
ncbi:SRPBCC domain-containing protein [Candidatus Uabimicrobium amorphum]|uniref:Polyketide cyclase n=1 Tax=Uabimicrobium amorphum TaxID=2596890 RepID=A0A5S9IN31_UABAM|nr:SRPBCC domain-containing protein [Candidatus Uabimicrobium amorphum]BBM84561.1 hypothetical protein UABAM_02922 [Candidatus Uabimicrobium amorphum]